MSDEVKPGLPIHSESGNPIAFMKLPHDIAPYFERHLAQKMAENPEWTELEARLRLGQKARYELADRRWIELRFEHSMEWNRAQHRHTPWSRFVVEIADNFVGSTTNLHNFEKAEEAFAMWDKYERQWALVIAEKALGLR